MPYVERISKGGSVENLTINNKTDMIHYFQKRFALSEKGAKDLRKGIFFSTLLNIALMLPVCYLFFFLTEYLGESDSVASHGVWFFVVMAIILMAVMYVIALAQYDSTYTTVYNESAQRRISMAEKLRHLPLAFFGERNLSDLTSTIMEDCTQLEHTFSHAVPQLFASAISIVLVAIGMFCYDWRLALSLFWVVPLAIATILLAKRKLDRSFEEVYHLKRNVTEKIQEGLETVCEIKSYSGEKEYAYGLDKMLKEYEKGLIEGELIGGIFVNLSVILLKLGMPSVILVGALLIRASEVSLFDYLAFLLASSIVYNPIQEVCNNLAMLFFLDVRIKRMKEMEAMPAQVGSKEITLSNFDIEFRNVIFSYEAGKGVLDGVSFTARQGEVTALVGPSGGGKSTTAKLAARFWDVTSGHILIGGMDIAQIDPETLLQHFAVVFQDVLLFNASIADNIRIGKHDASDEEVMRVARLAQCDEFIGRMPEGYNTLIGENGETLSGGERQRLSIARALLKDAPIILLDEATASLDAENETKIQAGISELVRNKTVLVIAHRMRTVRNADHIVVLKDGKVCEEGTPEALISRNGVFAHMVTLQQEQGI